MSVSRTGLTVSPKKVHHRVSLKKSKCFELAIAECAITKSVQYSIRPFDALFNPYSQNCSILCNHPGPNDIKQVVKQVKELYVEGKGNLNATNDNYMHGCDDYDGHCIDPAKEEFFHHYAGSDSRPLTPTPTVISNRTRISNGSFLLRTRRCHTPDPVHTCATEKTQIVLDLRRSHSQETIYCNASSDLSLQIAGDASIMTPKSGKVSPTPPTKPNMRLCEQEARKRSAERKAIQQLKECEPIPSSVVCINDRNDAADEEVEGNRRRGKKKKKPKDGNTFRMSQEPETQITTLGPDSPNASARPNGHIVSRKTEKQNTNDTSRDCGIRDSRYLRSNFITEDALRILRRGLNVDIVESAFEKFMNKALKEALRTIPKDQFDKDSLVLSEFKSNFGIKHFDNEKWLLMPRKFTRSATRFSLPINTIKLTTLTPFEYVSQYIWISNHRKHLYRFVFNKYLSDPNDSIDNDCNEDTNNGNVGIGIDGDGCIQEHERDTPSNDTNEKSLISFYNFKECIIPFEQLNTAFVDVLGYCGPIERCSEKIVKIIELTNVNASEHPYINFRSWCGLVAFAERYLNPLPMDVDPCDEVEIADFETLERKLGLMIVPEPLKKLLMVIKYNDK